MRQILVARASALTVPLAVMLLTSVAQAAATQMISFVFAPCESPVICVGGFAEAQVIQEGFAQVTVPHPSTLALLALGSIVWRIANRRRR